MNNRSWKHDLIRLLLCSWRCSCASRRFLWCGCLLSLTVLNWSPFSPLQWCPTDLLFTLQKNHLVSLHWFLLVLLPFFSFALLQSVSPPLNTTPFSVYIQLHPFLFTCQNRLWKIFFQKEKWCYAHRIDSPLPKKITALLPINILLTPPAWIWHLTSPKINFLSPQSCGPFFSLKYGLNISPIIVSKFPFLCWFSSQHELNLPLENAAYLSFLKSYQIFPLKSAWFFFLKCYSIPSYKISKLIH